MSSPGWRSDRAPSLSSESGFIIPIIMFLILIGLLLGAAALDETLASRSNATRDDRSARALQAADAGVQTELYRANQLNLGTLKLSSGLSLSTIIGQLLTCPVPQINAGGQVIGLQFAATASVGSPCPSNSSSGISSPGPNEEPVGNHTYFQTAFIPGATNVGDFIQLNPKIVAIGIDDNNGTQVTRRIEAILQPVTPWRTLEATHNLTIDVPPALSALGVKLAGTTVFNGTAAAGNNLMIDGQGLLANVFTASNISLSGGLTAPSALDYCNNLSEPNVTVGLTLGNVTKPPLGCGGLVNRAPISISASKQDCVPTGGVETCSSDSGFGSVYVGGNQDEIYNTNSTKTISFSPGDYVFCSFETNGPVNLNPTSTQAVRIFIDSPSSSRCKNFANHAGTLPSNFQAGPGSFVATQGVGNVLGLAHPSQAQVYVVGNGTNDGTIAYSTGGTLLSSQDMFLYAPTSNVTVTGGQTCVVLTCVNTGTIAGAFIGYDVDASAIGVTEDLGLLNYPLSSSLGPFSVKQYLECSPQYPLSASDPANGC